MRLRLVAIIILLSLLLFFGFKKVSADKNKEQSTNIEQLNILKYIPENNKLLFISNLDSFNIIDNNEKDKNTKNQDNFVFIKDSILDYLGIDLGNNKLEENRVHIKLEGSAGQSLGAFLTKGIKLTVEGDCNDYVGKGLSGGTIVVYPSSKSSLVSNENTIIGNTVLYGATSGKLFASGQAGERFAVRNSGSFSVVEGCGAHGCEYMTGGTAIILGEVGDNFGAGMTGGMAFVYDKKNTFENFVNPTSIIWQEIETDYWKSFLKDSLNIFVKETNSKIGKSILDNFKDELKNFKQICPIEMLDKLKNPISLKTSVKKAS